MEALTAERFLVIEHFRYSFVLACDWLAVDYLDALVVNHQLGILADIVKYSHLF
jgi:hypothetical protein